MNHPQLPYTLFIPAGGQPVMPAVSIPVRDLADASCAYQDHRWRRSGRAINFPGGTVTIGNHTYTVTPDGQVWYDNHMIVSAQ